MLDDAVLTQGRQTKRKWKYVGMLLVAALLCIGGAWIMIHPEIMEETIADLRKKLLVKSSEAWIPLSWTGDVYDVTGEMVIGAGDGCICVSDLEGRMLYRLDVDIKSPQIVSNDQYAVIYEADGTELVLVEKTDYKILEVSGGVELAVPGSNGEVAIITDGSGFLTMTKLLMSTGEEVKRIGFTDQAMAMMVYLADGTLASCCVNLSGQWGLRFDTRENELEVPLFEEIIYEVKPCDDGVALWSSEGIRFYDTDGNQRGQYVMRDDMLLDWDCGDYAALVIRRFGKYRLLIVTPEGDIVAEHLLSELPRKLLVCGNRICMLDSEALLVYDNKGVLLERSNCGARAGDMMAAADGLLLFGDGEMLYHQIP